MSPKGLEGTEGDVLQLCLAKQPSQGGYWGSQAFSTTTEVTLRELRLVLAPKPAAKQLEQGWTSVSGVEGRG